MAQDISFDTIDVLIGSDYYWQLVSGGVVRGNDGPVALHTNLGWVLTGPASSVQGASTTSLVALSLKPTSNNSKDLERQLKTFWELEALGILNKKISFYEQFKHNIKFVDGKYEVPLP